MIMNGLEFVQTKNARGTILPGDVAGGNDDQPWGHEGLRFLQMRKPHTPRPIWMTGGLTLHRRDTLNQKTSAFGHDGFFTWSGWWFGTFFIFPYIGNNHPNWLIFFRGVQTTNLWSLVWSYWWGSRCSTSTHGKHGKHVTLRRLFHWRWRGPWGPGQLLWGQSRSCWASVGWSHCYQNMEIVYLS